ncbi:MAG: ABC transporter permease [Bacteroidales bacterium]|nr:ABC transporter permease [Bacteroidales bacterium]
MFYFILKKLFYGLLVVFGVVSLVFLLFNILPADPARMMLGQRADKESIELIHKDLGLDKPKTVQYFNYLNDISPLSFHSDKRESNFFFDKTKYSSSLTILKIKNSRIVLKKPYLRRSYQSKREVSSVLYEAFINTFILALASILFAFVVGVILGCISSLYADTWLDRLIQFLTSAGMSIPSFFAAIIIAWFFAFILADWTHLSMFGSLKEVDDLGNGEHIALKNLILPALTLGIRPLAVITELTKSTMLEVFRQDYIKTAKAKGLSTFNIIYHHALKNALNPVITAISGWFASLMAGAVFVEYIFDWKGMGVVIVNSLETYDFPVIMASLLLISVFLVLINIVTDIIYGFLDPSVRKKMQ